MYKLLIGFFLPCLLALQLVVAEDTIEEYFIDPGPSPDEFADAPAPPVLPDPLQSGEPIEPEVTIIQREDAVVEEYRVNGRLYKVKVTPVVGPAYYLIDHNGDGRMTRMNELRDNYIVPQWVIFSW